MFRKKFSIPGLLFQFFLLLYALISLYPLIWMVFYSLKNNDEIFLTNPFGPPTILHIENYLRAWNTYNLPVYFKNSLIVSLATVAFTILLAVLFAYALARMKFKGQHFLRMLTSLGLFIPIQVIMIPIAVLVRDLHINSTLWAVIVPYTAFNLSFAIMVMYGAMRGLPFEFEESACIDGANVFQCLLHIIVPNLVAPISTVSIFVFLNAWNEFNLALILLTKDHLKTMPLGLLFFQGEFTTDWGAMGAAMVIASIPTVIIYCFFSDKVENAMTVSGAVK
ncbi:carbohydrate ABC transporter permease [Lachnospiraceae bacterium ZAX-1]